MATPDPGQERHLTDSGLTGDKVRASDPAAAPVQTDAETAGTPTPRKAAWESARRQMEIAFSTPRPDTFGAWRQLDPEYQRRLGWVLLAWTSVLVVVGVVAGVMSWP